MTREDLDDFVTAYSASDRTKRVETERFKKFTYADLVARDKTNLDITWLKDDSETDVADLPDPDTLIAEIIEEVTGIEPSEITPEKSFVDDLDIDSLSMVEIAVQTEDKYGVNGNTILHNWPPSSREVVGSPAFAELQITFSYSLLATSGNITMTTDNVFRMEPQQ